MHVFEAIHYTIHYVLINARLLILSKLGNIFFVLSENCVLLLTDLNGRYHGE